MKYCHLVFKLKCNTFVSQSKLKEMCPCSASIETTGTQRASSEEQQLLTAAPASKSYNYVIFHIVFVIIIEEKKGQKDFTYM